MSEQKRPRKTILLIHDEELFPPFLQHFSVSDYQVLFATGAAEAMILCEAHNPALMVLPLDGAGKDLASALAQVRRENNPILGVCTSHETGASALEWLGESDQTVVSDDPDQVINAAREMLNERRGRPRVNVEFPVKLGEKGGGIAQDVSASSLMIHTLEPIEAGQRLFVEIGWGDRPYRFEAEVMRVQQTALGPSSVVLEVPEDASDTREYLDRLVRRINEVEHYLRGSQTGLPALRGPAAWKLARRAEESIRRSRELQALHNVEVPTDASEFETRYKLGKVLGRWGVGDVHEATHRLLDRPVWVKVLSDVVKDDPVARERFEQEAQVASTLLHKGIIDVIDFGAATEGSLYYAMEALSGETLAETLKRGTRFTVLDAGRLGVRLADALAHAHKNGVGHQDLCPANIFLVRETERSPAKPKLVNFSGKMTTTLAAEAYAQGEAFAPPEAKERPPEPSWDIFALGAVLRHVVPAGTHRAASPGTRRLEVVLDRATAELVQDRHATMAELAADLRQCLELLESEKAADVQPVVAAVPGISPTSKPDAARVAERPVPAEKPEADAGKAAPSAEKEIKQGAEPPAVVEKRAAQEWKTTLEGRARAPKVRPVQAGRELPAVQTEGHAPEAPVKKAIASVQRAAAEEQRPAVPGMKPAGVARPAKAGPASKKTLLWAPSVTEQPGPSAAADGDALPAGVKPEEGEPKAEAGQVPTPADAEAERKKAADEQPSERDAVVADQPDEMAIPSSIDSLLSDELEAEPASEEETRPLDEEAEVRQAAPSVAVAAAAAPAGPQERSYRLKMVIGIGVFVVGVVLVGVAVIWGVVARSRRKAEQGPAAPVAERVAKTRPDSGVSGDSAARDGAVHVRRPDGGAAGPVVSGADGGLGTGPRPRAAADGGAPADHAQDAVADPDHPRKSRHERRSEALNTARLLIRKGRYIKARVHLDRALKLGDGARVRELFARSFARDGQLWPAIHHMNKALKFSPRSAGLRVGLGTMYLRVGKRAEACRRYREALRLRPGYKSAQKRLRQHCGGGPRPSLVEPRF